MDPTVSSKLFLRALNGEITERPPVWFMRQAGRYLPEYREVRSQSRNFLDFCYSPDLATEVTLQPIRRYGFDASIVFADILLIPDALGQDVRFEEGIGPVLEPANSLAKVEALNLDRLHDHLAPVYETVRRVRAGLPEDVTLIGFAGAPWTVATYMIGGKGSPTHAAAKLFAFREPEAFGKLMDLLVDATVTYLEAQIEAGAEVIQLFDTWAGLLSPQAFAAYGVAPVREIVSRVGEKYPDVPFIGFPRGVGPMVSGFAKATGVKGISLDTSMDLEWAAEHVQDVTLQGNLDPLLLVSGGAQMRKEAEAILETMKERAFVFNLGHGIVPETPPDNVGEVVDLVKNWSRS